MRNNDLANSCVTALISDIFTLVQIKRIYIYHSCLEVFSPKLIKLFALCYITLNFSPLKALCQHACANSATQIVEVYFYLVRCSRTKFELFFSAPPRPGRSWERGVVLSSITASAGPFILSRPRF